MEEVEIAGFNFDLTVLTLPDRRSGTAVHTRWLLSSELEALLYGNTNSTGVLRKLVIRAKESSGRTDAVMLLRSSNVGGLVTAAEWSVVAALMTSGAREISLLPEELAVVAMHMYGKEPVTTAILIALDKLPTDWESDEDEGEDEEDEDGSAEQECGHEDYAGEDGASNAGAADGSSEDNSDADKGGEEDGNAGSRDSQVEACKDDAGFAKLASL